jgi:hypothetical protein
MSLVSDAEAAILSGNFLEVFQAFSKNRTITVHKEPLKTFVSTPDPNTALFGFGETQQQAVYNYTPQNQSFNAIVRYGASYRTNMSSEPTEADIFFSKGMVQIMVQRDCHDYIVQDKTLKIELDGRAWMVVGEPRAKKFLLNDYYVFYLQNLQ